MNSTTLWIAQTLASAFLGVLFLQSGLDKVLDWKGNREYITGYFAKTPLKMFTAPMFVSITILEVLTGVLSAAGSVTVLITQRPNVAFLGAVLAGLTILGLFFGQRIAKDYAAAAGMVPYALYSLLAILLLGYRGF